ncbi:MAG: redoxin domain-containing protein, partial [Cyanobacteria bacterium P01_A01_bin.17]
MSLTTDLQTQKEQFLDNVPDETVQVMGKATQALAESGIVDQSLKAGQKAPPVQLPNATGNTVDLQELLKSGPVVLSFYRGQWCPYCNLELRALQQILPEIQTLGAS